MAKRRVVGNCFMLLRGQLGDRHAESGSVFGNAMAPSHTFGTLTTTIVR